MSTPQFMVFCPKVQNQFFSSIVSRLGREGCPALIDSTHINHDWAGWFKEQFSGLDHRVFYNLPSFLTGFIQDVDINVMGIPHLILYFTTHEEKKFTSEMWGVIDKWVNKILNDVDLLNEADMNLLNEIIVKHVEPELLHGPEPVEEDDFVTITDAKNHYYTFESKSIPEYDKVIVSVSKPDFNRPFTIIISEFSKNGYKNLFTDLFSSLDWGSVLDVNFLNRLWKELKMCEEFNLDKRLEDRTKQFLPNEEGECPAEPQVYRMHIDDILKSSSFGRIFY